MPKIWYHFFDGKPASEREIIKALEEAGLEIQEPNLSPVTGPGIFFFNTVTPQLYDFVHDISRNGLERILAIALNHSDLPHGDTWGLLKSGVSDVLTWDQTENTAKYIAERFERWNAVDELVESTLVQNNLIGKSTVWKSLLRQIVEVAYFTDASITITGESGTGKELVAHLIHNIDPKRHKKDLMVLDCTTIVSELSGSEFFGHEQGAFTGAVKARDGAFALANGGTLFLDEVGELPLKLQSQLLRVVQERTFKRVGGNTWHQTDFRLVCATNKDLSLAVNQGRFRQDLYYRITGWSFKLPPLKERTEDIIPLTQHFMKELHPDGKFLELDKTVCEYLLKREYPGNVRDLKQLIARIMSRHVGSGPITVGDISEEERPIAEFNSTYWCDEHFEKAIRRALSFGVGLKEIGRTAENAAMRIAIENEKGSLQRAANILGVTDRALQLRRASNRQNEK